MKKINISIVLSMLLVISCILTFGNGAPNVAQAQSVARGEGDNAPPLLPGGWINMISEEAIVINDTQYTLTGETRYPDGRDVLKEGEFVRFRSKEGKILSEIFLAEPRKREMYMKPVVRSEKSETSPSEESVSPPATQSESEDSEMRLENGVWVN